MDLDNNIDESEVSLLSMLNKKNADVQCLMEDWWTVYDASSRHGLKAIMELFYRCSGWLDFIYEADKFDDVLILNHIKQKASMASCTSPSSLNRFFIDRYELFLTKLLEFNDYQLLYTESFITPLINSCSLLINGPWTSYRMTATITGMTIMTRLQFLNEYILNELRVFETSNSDREVLLEKKTNLFQLWYHLFMRVFRLAIRDATPEIRTCALDEMHSWASTMPSLLLGKRWKKYLYFGLRDTNSNNRDTAFAVCHLLFKNEVDAAKQKDLFNFLKMEFIFTLKTMKGVPQEISISICTDVIRYLDIEFSLEERATIFMCVFSETPIVAIKAARYLIIEIQSEAESPIDIINSIVVFREEAKVRAESLLMDALYYCIRDELSWNDWFTAMIVSPVDKVASTVALFFAYVLKAVTGYTPPIRMKSRDVQVKNLAMAEDKARFTKSVEQHWMELVNLDKIIMQPETLVRLIKVLQFCGISLSSMVALRIMELLSNIITTSNDKSIILESCKSLRHLMMLYSESDANNQISVVFNNLVYVVTTEFMEYLKVPSCTLNPTQLHNRIILLCQNFNFEDQIIWDTCTNFLINTNDSVTNNLRDDLIITLMKILHQRFSLLLKQLLDKVSKKNGSKKVSDASTISSNSDDSLFNNNSGTRARNDDSNTGMSALIDKINSRGVDMEDIIKKFLSNPFSRSINIAAFKIFSYFLESLGSHNDKHPSWRVRECVGNVDNEVVSLMRALVEDLFKTDCSSSIQQSVIDSKSKLTEDCCLTVQRYCQLLGLGIIDWSCSSNLILLMKEHPGHAECITNSIKIYAKSFPRFFYKPAIAIYNAVATSVKLSLSDNVPEDQILASAKEILENVFPFKKVKDCQEFYPIILFFHRLLISQAFSRSGIKLLLKLLYPLRVLLREKDIPSVLSTLNKYKERFPQDIAEYTTLLEKRNITQQPSHDEQADTS